VRNKVRVIAQRGSNVKIIGDTESCKNRAKKHGKGKKRTKKGTNKKTLKCA
jgi:hypothetical protein